MHKRGQDAATLGGNNRKFITVNAHTNAHTLERALLMMHLK
jgi:hypothetical protein